MFDQVERTISEIAAWSNAEWLHSSLGYLTPWSVYQGMGAAIQAGWWEKLTSARQRRRDANLQRRQARLAPHNNSCETDVN